MNRFTALIASALLFAVGCVSSGRPNGVPYGGQLVGEAPAQVASFTVPRDGTIWVVGPGHPGDTRYIIYSGLVKMKQVVTVDPQQRILTIDGEKMKAAVVDGGKVYYQIWFQPTPEGD
jgi:hypothetical protein